MSTGWKGPVLWGAMLLMAAGCMRLPEDRLLENPPAEASAIESEKRIVLGADIYVPYQYEENGQVKGIAVDLVNTAFQRMGYTVEMRIYPWARVLASAREGAVDGIFSAFYIWERTDYMTYSQEPLIDSVQMLYTRAGSPVSFDGNLQSLGSYRLGIVRGYVYGNDFKQAQEDGILKVSEGEDCLVNIQKLQADRIDLFVENRDTAQFYIRQQGLADRVVELPVPLSAHESLYLAMSNRRVKDKALLEVFDATLREMKADGTWQRIVNTYIQ